SGHAEDFAAELHGEARGDERTAVLRAFDDDYAERHAGDDSVADREIFRRWVCAQREFADDGAALENFFVEFLVFFGIADADGSPVGSHGALVADGVDAAGHAADDDEAAGGEIAAEALRHLRAVESGLSGADDAEAREIEDFGIAANVEKDRGIVDLQKRLGIFGFGPVEQTAAIDVARGGEFFFGAFERFFFEDGLGDGSGEAAAFEFGERGAEDGVG